jgi:hypothetical protein
MSDIDKIIQSIEEGYDGDFDILPGHPLVNWTDKRLLEIVKQLNYKVRLLEEQVENLQNKSGYFDNRLSY